MTVMISGSTTSDANEDIPRRNIINQCLATASATIGLFALGTVLGWSSPALPDLVKEENGFFFNVTTEQQSWIGSIATLGALASAPVSGFTVERIGRKGSMILFSFPFILGWLVIAFATNTFQLCVGRFITGFCGGSYSLCVPLYVGESVSSHIRGLLLNSIQMMMVTGILLTYVIGSLVSWKTLTLISSLIPLLFLVSSPFIPESPMFLQMKGQTKDYTSAINWFQGSPPPEGTAPEKKSPNKKYNYLELLRKPEVLRPLLISLTLMILEQACAFNVVIFYCVDIFAQAGADTGLNEYWSSIVVAIVQCVATLIAMYLVDKVGRRPLLIISEFVMGLSFVSLGTFFYCKKHDYQDGVLPEGMGFMPLASVLLFIIAYAIGIGPLSWTVMGEILHPEVRGFCAAVATGFVWISAFVVTKIWRGMVEGVGIDKAFWIFAGVSLLGTGVVWGMVPETKGKSLEEIQMDFLGGNEKKGNEMIKKTQDTLV